MATKVFCDGCDTDMTDGKNESRKGLRVNTTCEAGPRREVLGQFEIGPFDLCGRCIQQFKKDVNPKTWPRAVEPARR
jgi:hypothetical protein